jgi:hypothetical protein
MKKIFCAIIIALYYPSFGQILEEYVPENLDVFISDTSLVIGNNFFNAPNENNRSIAYPISGVFSMYLIEKYCLEKYKLLFKAEKGENGFPQVYELKLDTILADFHSWIDSK